MSELRNVLEKHGFKFKKQFGQNFISDTNLLQSIVTASGITKDTTVVEIGCGAGTLTRAIAENAKKGVVMKTKSPQKTARSNERITLFSRVAIGVVAVVLIVWGIANGGMADVLGKAINICTQCIGLG